MSGHKIHVLYTQQGNLAFCYNLDETTGCPGKRNDSENQAKLFHSYEIKNEISKEMKTSPCILTIENTKQPLGEAIGGRKMIDYGDKKIKKDLWGQFKWQRKCSNVACQKHKH